jgi:acyl dehydratase
MCQKSKWDEINVGDQIGPLEYVITEAMVNDFANAVEDYHDWYIKDSPFGGRIAHPTMLATDQDALFIRKWGPAAGLHAKHTTEFMNPVIVGKKVKVIASVVEKYIKREKKYLTMEYVYTDEDGLVLVRHLKTDVYVLKD